MPGGELPPCAHCEAPLTGPFCAQCGQKAAGGLIPLRQLLGDFFDEALSFDGRLVRTLIDLVQPGRLTRRYSEGHRVPYISPVKLFLVATVILFGSSALTDPNSEAQVEVASAPTSVGDAPGVEAEEEGVEETLQQVQKGWSHAQEESESLRSSAPWARALNEAVQERLSDRVTSWVADPAGFGEAFRDRLSTLVIIAIPFLALLMKILWWRHLYVFHMVVALHAHSFAFMVVAAAMFLIHGAPWQVNLGQVLLATVPLWLWLNLKRVYGDGWGWLLTKAGLLLAGWFGLLLMLLLISMLWLILE